MRFPPDADEVVVDDKDNGWNTVAFWLNEQRPLTAVRALELSDNNFGSIVPAVEEHQSGSSSDVAEAGVDSRRRWGVAGNWGRTSSILTGESVMVEIRFRSLQAAMMDNGEAQRLERQDGPMDRALDELMLGQPRFFR